jgi:zinc protease
MYANDPRAPIAVPRPEYFDNINLNRAMQIYKERVGDVTGMHFVIIGNIDIPKMKPLVEQYLGALPANGKKQAFKDNGLRPAKGKVDLNVYKGKEEKSLILAMHSGEVPYSEDLNMNAEAISEILNIRIIEELREKIQGIYSGGTNGGLNKIPYPSFQFFIQLPCGPEKVDTLLLAMNTEIENLKKKGPSEADMQKVKEQWIEQNKEAMKENGTWLNKMLELNFPGADVNRFLKYPEFVNKLTAKGVQDAANVLLNNKNVVTAVLRPEAKTDSKASTVTAKPGAAATIGGRKTDVQKLVELPAAEFTVDVFDNGDIDGDIITLYWNGEAVVTKQTLSDKPITVSLKIDPSRPKNELLMYAENLGTTPPNTAVAYAVCNGQRIEIRLSSDNDKNGTAQFKVKK